MVHRCRTTPSSYPHARRETFGPDARGAQTAREIVQDGSTTLREEALDSVFVFRALDLTEEIRPTNLTILLRSHQRPTTSDREVRLIQVHAGRRAVFWTLRAGVAIYLPHDFIRHATTAIVFPLSFSKPGRHRDRILPYHESLLRRGCSPIFHTQPAGSIEAYAFPE